MKKFLIIFLVMQILLLGYIFDSSIFNIYEKNNIGDTSLNGYLIIDSTGDNLSKVYNELTTEYSDIKLQVIKYSVDMYDNAVYRIYSSPTIEQSNKTAISKDICFEYYDLQQADFVDGAGIFYTDLSLDDILSFSQNVGISITEYQNDYISYGKIVSYNLYNYVILILITQMVCFIYTSSNLKEISAKRAVGYSNLRIVSDMIREICLYDAVIIFVLMVFKCTFLFFSKMLSVQYILLFLCYYMAIAVIHALQMLVTTIVLHYISIDEMIKNRNFLRRKSIAMSVIKVVLLVAVAITVSTISTTINEYEIAESNALKLSNLSDYYGAYGFYSDEYDRMQNTNEVRRNYSSEMKSMYMDNNNKGIALLCDNRQIESYIYSSFLKNNGMSVDEFYRSYNLNYMTVNETYLQTTGLSMYIKNNATIPYILVPEMYREQENEVKDFFVQYYNGLMQYDNNYERTVVIEPEMVDNLDIVYISNNYPHDVLFSEGYVTVFNSVLVVDTQSFGGLYYLDVLNNARNLYFNYNTRDELGADLVKYNLENLIIPATLLTPFSAKLESAQFVLNMLTVFLVLFIGTLIFIVFTANYTNIMANRKVYATKAIMGFTTPSVLTMQFLLSTSLIFISLLFYILLHINVIFLIGLIALDLSVLVALYRIYILRRLPELQKGE